MVDFARRGFLFGLGATAVAAPAIVRAASLMPIRGEIIRAPASLLDDLESIEVGSAEHQFILRTSLPQATWRKINQGVPYLKTDVPGTTVAGGKIYAGGQWRDPGDPYFKHIMLKTPADREREARVRRISNQLAAEAMEREKQHLAANTSGFFPAE